MFMHGTTLIYFQTKYQQRNRVHHKYVTKPIMWYESKPINITCFFYPFPWSHKPKIPIFIKLVFRFGLGPKSLKDKTQCFDILFKYEPLATKRQCFDFFLSVSPHKTKQKNTLHRKSKNKKMHRLVAKATH